MTTKISPYRTGELRFGTKDPTEPVHGEVKTYFLSPEELEAYKNAPKREQVKMSKPINLALKKGESTLKITKEGFTLAVYKKLSLDFEGELTDKEIMEKYGKDGITNHFLYTKKNEWDLPKQRGKRKKEHQEKPKLDWESAYHTILKENELLKGRIIELQPSQQELQRILGLKEKNIKELERTIREQEELILSLQMDLEGQEEDLGFEEMKDELNLYKQKAEKLGELVKLYI